MQLRQSLPTSETLALQALDANNNEPYLRGKPTKRARKAWSQGLTETVEHLSCNTNNLGNYNPKKTNGSTGSKTAFANTTEGGTDIRTD
jgi:hypothetical protein